MRAAIVAGLVVGIMAPLAGRVAFEGSAELEAAAGARAEEDIDAEIEHLGRAARWRLPLASHDERALDRLLEIGAEYEAKGVEGTQRALAAYREVRRALLATRAWGVPHEDRFELANAHIATLMAAQEQRFGTDLSGGKDAEAYHLELLDRVPGPNPWLANAAALSFMMWVVAVGGFLLRAIDAHGHLRPRPALRWGGLSLIALVAWMILLRVS